MEIIIIIKHGSFKFEFVRNDFMEIIIKHGVALSFLFCKDFMEIIIIIKH